MKPFLACLVLAAGATGTGAVAQVAPGGAQLVRTLAEYRVPAVRLQRADGTEVRLADELDYDGPVALNFVFTTCSAICPIQSRVFAELQQKGGPGLRLLSISLDPLNDTPAQLRDYGRRFGAGNGWHFYTGTLDASSAAQRAFDVYRGNKMNHQPLVLLRSGAGRKWVRIEGYASADQLLRELRAAPMTAKNTVNPVGANTVARQGAGQRPRATVEPGS
jgi:protein SCO1/2